MNSGSRFGISRETRVTRNHEPPDFLLLQLSTRDSPLLRQQSERKKGSLSFPPERISDFSNLSPDRIVASRFYRISSKFYGSFVEALSNEQWISMTLPLTRDSQDRKWDSPWQRPTPACNRLRVESRRVYFAYSQPYLATLNYRVSSNDYREAITPARSLGRWTMLAGSRLRVSKFVVFPRSIWRFRRFSRYRSSEKCRKIYVCAGR